MTQNTYDFFGRRASHIVCWTLCSSNGEPILKSESLTYLFQVATQQDLLPLLKSGQLELRRSKPHA